MNTYTYEILQSDIFTRISLLTHYTGFKATADSSAFDRVATVSANDEALSQFYDQSVNQLVILLSPFISTINYTKTVSDKTVNGLFVTLSMPCTWDSHLLPAIITAGQNYLVARIAEQWFRLTNKEAVAEQTSDASAAVTELHILLYSKTRPALPSEFQTSSDDDDSSTDESTSSGTTDTSTDDDDSVTDTDGTLDEEAVPQSED